MRIDSLFTVGHSNHSEQDFTDILLAHKISAIADVRSQPYSQYTPQFNREILQRILHASNIHYVFLGRELGARRHEDSCYIDGKAKYKHIAQLPLFCTGLDRLLQGAARYRVAIMCSEADPITCHRMILICRKIKKSYPSLPIYHILGNGDLETHKNAQERLIELHHLQPELFGDLTSTSGLIEKAYELQAGKLECQKEKDEE
ncbi:MAG: DUF488 domain-containing protein [Candidatus Hydrogenedentes bacterium]|nr:DUF488 domain-containing protein [Candidatus Hydrogenedentota bacterium]